MRKRAGVLPLLAVVATALSACSHETTLRGEDAAFPNPTAYATSQTKRFDAAYASMSHGMTDGHAVRGTMFAHASFGSKSTDSEWDVTFFGDPASVFVKSRIDADIAGYNLDTLHTPGSPYDYILLGDKYRPLVRTPWAQVPTAYGTPLGGFNVCTVTGYQTVCDLEDAVDITRKSGKSIVKRISPNEQGGSTLLTGVTLESMLKYNFLLDVPPEIAAQFTASQRASQIPVRFILDSKSHIQLVQASGTFPGKTPLQVQVGYQVTGDEAGSGGFPAAPVAGQFTPLTRAQYNAVLTQTK